MAPRKLDEGNISELIYNGEIGSGSFGAVHNGVFNHKSVAIKVSEGKSANKRQQFENEKMAGEKLRHGNLMPLIAYGEDNDKYYLVYERMSSNLADDITGLSWNDVVRILKGIAQGLEHIHGKGYVHGDFKPHNVLLTRGKEANITDFGTLSRDGGGSLSNFTRGYAAPELIRGGPPTKKSDVFSFGIVLIQLLSRSMDLERQVKRGEEKELQERAKVLFGVAGQHVVHNNFMAPESCASEDTALALTELAINCTKRRPEGRPTMNEVIRALNDLI